MTAAKQIPLVSVSDYLAGERVSKKKHEYTGGYVYEMAGGRIVHNIIATGFLGLMHAGLRGRPCQPFNSDTKVRIRMPTHSRFYYPDGMVVCEPNPPNDEFQDRPTVIAEVTSISTRRTDEGEKREAYLTIPTLSAYLLIETERPRVAVHQRTPEGFVAQVYEGMEATVPLEAIDTDLPLAELYERVDFAAAAREADEEADEWGFPRPSEH
ncbi:MAG TPA: Uma2 family endonuclease [Tepidisphaeraceae bacterium]|nr:Uma2 family endonuclease [Tepidisphaeraceae bacterium]